MEINSSVGKIIEKNLSTKTNTLWKMIHKISGKKHSTSFQHLMKNNTQVTNIKDIADTLAETFTANSSSINSNAEFREYKDKKKNKSSILNRTTLKATTNFFHYQN